MFDLHCHLLPGVDDGPATTEESLALCRMAVADGITHAVVTPHIHPGRWENSKASIDHACCELQALLTEHEIPLRLGFAGEVRLSDRLLQQVAEDEIPYYGEVDGYRILLLEFPHGHLIPGSQKLARWLLGQGIRPMIAHPERNRQIMQDVALLEPFLDIGCWLQLTAGSVLGKFGEKPRSIALQLLHNDKVAVLASDGHNAGARPPVLSQAFDYIVREFGNDRALQLMRDTPATITRSQYDTHNNRLH